MNVLQILPELNAGGVETGTLDLAKYLVKLGHKAVVVSSGGSLVKDIEALGAVHYQLNTHDKNIFNILKSARQLADIIRKENIDIVHARSRVPAWIAYFASRKTERALITTCHGYYSRHPFSYVMGWGKFVIVVSNVIARHMIENLATPYERIRLIPRSVDLDKFKFTEPSKKRKKDEFNVGIIGRVTPIKGHLHFVKAMAKVSRNIPYLKVWIVGDAPASKEAYKDQVQVMVRRLGLWHCTQFLGFQKNVAEVLTHMDLLVVPTTAQEAFGRVIIEAQASGVPVIASKVGGIVDVIEDQVTGLLVPAADPQAIAEATTRIFKDPDFSGKLARNAYSRVKEKYNVELMVKSTIGVYEESLRSQRILIIKLSSLGDIILSSAALRAIRNKFGKDYKITALVSEENKDLLLRCPYIDELLVCNFKGKDKGLRGLWNLSSLLRKKCFDMVIDLQNNRKSHILAFLSGSCRRYGYSNNKLGRLLNYGIKDDKEKISPLKHQFKILNKLGIELKDDSLQMWVAPEDQKYIDDFLGSEWLSAKQKLVGINISSSIRWESKSYPQAHLLRLCQELSKLDIRVVLTGSKHDCALADELVKKLGPVKVINACGRTTINQLASLISRCSVYVSADSAPLHVASSQKVPFVALFGPTDSSRHLPPAQEGKFILIKKELPCAPCYKPKCNTKKCMEMITPQEVLEAVKKLL